MRLFSLAVYLLLIGGALFIVFSFYFSSRTRKRRVEEWPEEPIHHYSDSEYSHTSYSDLRPED